MGNFQVYFLILNIILFECVYVCMCMCDIYADMHAHMSAEVGRLEKGTGWPALSLSPPCLSETGLSLNLKDISKQQVSLICLSLLPRALPCLTFYLSTRDSLFRFYTCKTSTFVHWAISPDPKFHYFYEQYLCAFKTLDVILM